MFKRSVFNWQNVKTLPTSDFKRTALLSWALSDISTMFLRVKAGFTTVYKSEIYVVTVEFTLSRRFFLTVTCKLRIIRKMTSDAVSYPRFSWGGCANSQKCYYFANFCRELHENERIWTSGGRRASLAPPPQSANVMSWEDTALFKIALKYCGSEDALVNICYMKAKLVKISAYWKLIAQYFILFE